jgi:hypothetical protein
VSQFSSTIQAPAVPAFGSTRQSLTPIAMIAVLLATIAIAVALVARPAPAVNPRAGEAADGWEAGLVAANTAVVAQGAQDGYLTGLMTGRGPRDATDGYLAGLLSARAAGDAVDGYLPALIAEHQIGAVDDGWERGITLFQNPRTSVEDGWEAGLR